MPHFCFFEQQLNLTVTGVCSFININHIFIQNSDKSLSPQQTGCQVYLIGWNTEEGHLKVTVIPHDLQKKGEGGGVTLDRRRREQCTVGSLFCVASRYWGAGLDEMKVLMEFPACTGANLPPPASPPEQSSFVCGGWGGWCWLAALWGHSLSGAVEGHKGRPQPRSGYKCWAFESGCC